ncbi:MAG: ferritin-like domain-containing protein [Planctomycetes bacterium]|nr:ferritin-like domain-containing protein [Planctomycetota bacterium]
MPELTRSTSRPGARHGPGPVSFLVSLLQRAHAGERAAALAYQGHAASVRDPGDRRRISEIEREELAHRECLGRLLETMGAGPDPSRERRAGLVGTLLSNLCRAAGWYFPMYAAGRLERRNIVEYEIAAAAAVRAGRPEFVEDLLRMAETEWEHERYFRLKAESHPLHAVMPKGSAPPPKASIRRAFAPVVAGNPKALEAAPA